MDREARRAGLLVLLLLLGACGGAGTDDAGVLASASRAAVSAPYERHVVLRVDVDRDGHADYVTVDAAARPLRVVEALQGHPDGVTDVTDQWRGRPLPGDLDRALSIYLERSLSVGAWTDLSVRLDGEPVAVSVIE